MVLKYLSDLKQIVTGAPTKRLVLAAAQDQFSLGAVIKAWKEGLIDPIFVGNKQEIEAICNLNNYDISGAKIVHECGLEPCIDVAVKMVSRGEADVLMKGKIGTAALLKAVLNKEDRKSVV